VLSSYWNNLRNRFEKFVGDAKHLRGRCPLAAIGILFVVRSTIVTEEGAFQFLADMPGRLHNPELFGAAGLVVVQWSNADCGLWRGPIDLGNPEEVRDRAEGAPIVSLVLQEVPDALHPARLCRELVACVLARTPVTFHRRCRELKLGQRLSVPEETRQEGREG
jgi:hypothetical protein